MGHAVGMTKRLLLATVLGLVGCGEGDPAEQPGALIDPSSVIGTWQAAVASPDGVNCTADTWPDARAFLADGRATRTVLGTTYPMLWSISGDVLSISAVDANGQAYIKDAPYAWEGTVVVRSAKCIELHDLHNPGDWEALIRK